MPMYDYGCTECGHSFEAFNTIMEREKPTIEPCPKCGLLGISMMILEAPGIVGGTNQKHSNEFNDRLKEIQKNSGRGNTIDRAIH